MVAELSKTKTVELSLNDLKTKYPGAYKQYRQLAERKDHYEEQTSFLWGGFVAGKMFIATRGETEGSTLYSLSATRIHPNPEKLIHSVYGNFEIVGDEIQYHGFMIAKVKEENTLPYFVVLDQGGMKMLKTIKLQRFVFKIPQGYNYIPGHLLQLGYEDIGCEDGIRFFKKSVS